MIKILSDVTEYLGFIQEINSDANYSEPMLSSEKQMQQNLFGALGRPENRVLGIFDKDIMTGLFVFLALVEESYIEMLVGLSKSEEAYDEMLHYLKQNYKGYEVDFVYNPNNYILYNKLAAVGASFEKEQQKMVWIKDVEYESDKQIRLYGPEYKEQYMTMHSKDGYWTAEKVLDALDRFRIILAMEKDDVVGYVDITYVYDENEPYEIFVKEEHHGKGYDKAMLAKAIELNKPKGMMSLVDADDTSAIAMYESLGFEKSKNENSVTAHVVL